MRIEFPEPCSEDWAAMTPTGRGRHCDACKTRVHDLARYRPEQAESLMSTGEACVRVQVLPNGRVATRPSRVGRTLTMVFAAPALLLALSGCVMGKPAPAEPTESDAASGAQSSGSPAEAK
jgi:hypothetical protein